MAGLEFDHDEPFLETFNILGASCHSDCKILDIEFENELKHSYEELISKVNKKTEQLKSQQKALEMAEMLFNKQIQNINKRMSQYRKSLDDAYEVKCKILEEKKLQLDNLKDEQEKQFQKKMQDFENDKQNIKKKCEIQEDIIKLDVGGNSFTTSVNTLCKDQNSMIAVMFSGRHNLFKSDVGSYFIDRDGTYFQYILNYLRGGIISPGDLPEDPVLLHALRRETDFYQIRGFTELLDECLEIPTEKVDYSQEEIRKMLSTVLYDDPNDSFNGFSLHSESNQKDFSPGIKHFISQSTTKCKLNFTNKKLNGISFAHTTFFHDVSFRNSHLVGASFYGCEFGVGVQINFNYADLSDCDFRQCKGKENGAKMNFAHGGGLLSASSSDTFLQMVQEGRISFKRAKIENTLFDPKVSDYLNFNRK